MLTGLLTGESTGVSTGVGLVTFNSGVDTETARGVSGVLVREAEKSASGESGDFPQPGETFPKPPTPPPGELDMPIFLGKEP